MTEPLWAFFRWKASLHALSWMDFPRKAIESRPTRFRLTAALSSLPEAGGGNALHGTSGGGTCGRISRRGSHVLGYAATREVCGTSFGSGKAPSLQDAQSLGS